MTNNRLFSASAPGFDEPLEMLSACHERIAAQITTLRKLVPHLAQHGLDREAREAIAGVVRYFTLAAPHHHADEEEDLFPALRAIGEGEGLITRILAEHRIMDTARNALIFKLQQHPGSLSSAEVEVFAKLYLDHIALEETELLPFAGRVLPPATLQTLGERMAARRKTA